MKSSADLLARAALAAGLALALTLAAPSASAQEPTSIVGTVLDETTFLPIVGGRVVLAETGAETTTDGNGNFLFQGMAAGRHTLRVSLPGFSTAVDQIEVTTGEVGFVQLYLVPLAAVLDEVMVLAGRDPTDRSVVVEGRNRESAVTAADLLLRQVPGLNMGRSGGVGGGSRLLIRGVKSFTGNNLPAIYLDGVRIAQSSASGPTSDAPKLAVLDDMPASQVKRIRVLKGPSAAAQFADSANGVILIETYLGDRDD